MPTSSWIRSRFRRDRIQLSVGIEIISNFLINFMKFIRKFEMILMPTGSRIRSHFINISILNTPSLPRLGGRECWESRYWSTFDTAYSCSAVDVITPNRLKPCLQRWELLFCCSLARLHVEKVHPGPGVFELKVVRQSASKRPFFHFLVMLSVKLPSMTVDFYRPRIFLASNRPSVFSRGGLARLSAQLIFSDVLIGQGPGRVEIIPPRGLKLGDLPMQFVCRWQNIILLCMTIKIL